MKNGAWSLVLASVDGRERAGGRGSRLLDILLVASEVDPAERAEGEELEDVDPGRLLRLVRCVERVPGGVRFEDVERRALAEQVAVSHAVHDLAVVALDSRD